MKLFANGWIDTQTDDGGSFFDLDVGDWDTNFGDSGGPLFILNSDGTRRPIGVYSGHNLPGVGADSMQWTNITDSHARGWLLTHAKEGNVDPRIGHSALWLSRHGKTADSWWGELDYSGPCRSDVDQDCDGWFDRNVPSDQIHDNCIGIANPGQEDSRGFGVGDACDPDGDGWTVTPQRFSPQPFAPDNCPAVFNPDQANCNEEAERASIARSTPVAILGDACDPVPCPNATAIGPPPPTTTCLTGPYLYRVVRDEIAITPVPPHRAAPWTSTAESVAIPSGVPTKARYCQQVQAGETNVVCDNQEQLRDRELWQDETAEERLVPRTDRPWQRVTLRDAREGAAVSRESNTGHLVTYAEGVARSVFWDYRADNGFWRRDGRDLVGSLKPGSEACTKSIFKIGTCLNGRFWLHADTDVGNTTTQVGGISVGSHGADLANYYFPIQPDKTVHVSPCETPPLDPCLMTPLACVADFLYRFEDGTCPMCALPELKAIADDRIQLPFVRKPGEEMFGVLWKDVIRPGGELVLGDMARDLLLSQHVVTAVETAAPRPGDIDAIVLAPDFAGDSFYFRVAPDATGDAFHVEAFAQGGGLMSGGSSSSLSSKASSSSTSSSAVPVESALGRLDARVVYSRVMGGAFVLGGHDSGGSPLYSVEYAPLFGAPYTISGWLFGDVLAATLTRPSTPEEHAAGTAAPSFLWTVERDPEAGDVRIVVREITRDEIGVPRFSVTIDAVEEDYALATAWDAADTVLLTASERTTGNWALAEVGGFLPCVADLGAFDPSCFTIRAQLKRTDLGIGGHLFRGIYAEHDALVMPTAVLDESSLVWKAQADRAPKPALGIAPVIAPQDFRGWWVQ